MLGASLRNSQPLPTLEEAFDPKRNAFAVIRFVLAALVLVAHTFPLGGFGIDPLQMITADRLSLGQLAVASFFTLSGFLITRSATGPISVGRFLWHRVLRIFPGYWACLLFCALIAAPMIGELEYGDCFRVFLAPKDSPQAYIFQNLTLFHVSDFSLAGIVSLHPVSIAGLLRHNPRPWIFNGSLWSLPFELGCYLLVAALAVTGLLRRYRSMTLLLFVASGSGFVMRILARQTFDAWFPYQGFSELTLLLAFFLAGSVLYLYREQIAVSQAALFIALALIFAAAFVDGLTAATIIAIPYALLYAACRLPIRNFDARGDFSYGIYIYAFPAQQLLAFLQVNSAGVMVYLFSALLLASLLAFFSFRLIEAPALRLKNVRLGKPVPVPKRDVAVETQGALVEPGRTEFRGRGEASALERTGQECGVMPAKAEGIV
jgi:peptidoglycan/LPS O-acetylase OafA/YrhL